MDIDEMPLALLIEEQFLVLDKYDKLFYELQADPDISYEELSALERERDHALRKVRQRIATFKVSIPQ